MVDWQGQSHSWLVEGAGIFRLTKSVIEIMEGVIVSQEGAPPVNTAPGPSKVWDRSQGYTIQTANMLLEQKQSQTRWRICHITSFTIHAAVILIILLPPVPIFVRPASVALGDWGKGRTVYISTQALAKGKRVADPEKPLLYTPVAKQIRHRFDQRATIKGEQRLRKAAEVENMPKLGSPYGSLFASVMSGSEIRPALPMVFPDPPVHVSEIPPGVVGSVVVEVTIDARGNVIETRLLQGLGYGIEEKVIATLRRWRFRPATKDGIPIPS